MKRRTLTGFGMAVALLAACGKSAPQALPPIAPIATGTSASTGSASATGSPLASGASSTSGSSSASGSSSSAPSGSASSSPSPTTSPSPAGPPTTSANLKINDEVRSGLFAAFVAYKQTTPDQLIGPNPGTIYYAYLAPSKTYWAMAYFSPSATATQKTQISMQDAGVSALFSHVAGAPWKAVAPAGGGGPYPCAGQLDPALSALWDMPINEQCPLIDERAARAGDDVTFVNNGGSDAPSGDYNGLVDLESINVSGNGEIWLDAETSEGDGLLVNKKPLRLLIINVTPETVTEFSVGASSVTSHVEEGTFDSSFAKRVKAAFSRSDTTYVVTVRSGNATLIQEAGPVGVSGDENYREP